MEVVRNWCDPFQPSDELTSLGSGYVAEESLKCDLLGAKEKGSKALVSFVTDRLQTNNVGFYETLSKLKLGTFRDVQKKASVRAGGRNLILRADRNLFARLLVIGQSRQMDLRELLKHELGLFPWSLASTDGSLAKTNKAALSKLLEDGVQCLTSIPPNTTAVIIDAMAMLQMFTRVPDRFADLAEMLLTEILVLTRTATRVDFVADQYPDLSIKNTERSKRGREGQVLFAISSREQPCPRQWKKFMSNGTNKTRLMHNLVSEWSTRKYAEKIGARTLYVTHGNNCTKIEVVDGTTVPSVASQLCSNQEEADTRMFLHAHHASSCGHTSVAIRSSDTDVEVLACYHQANISASITLISGTRCRSRLISVPSLCQQLGPEICQLLPGLHALTGCDTVSTFVGKGKNKALKMVMEKQDMRSKLGGIGETVPPGNEVIANVEHFVCALYNGSGEEGINEIRYKMFCKSKNMQSHQLPRTKAALKHHIKRANYQAYLWKNSLQRSIEDQNPNGQGWQLKDGQLEVVWSHLAPAPDGVMQLVCCSCNRPCDSRRCSCVKNCLPCTEACTCNDDCTNCSLEQEDEDGDEDEDNEEDVLEY